ncbi:Clp protease ClpP [Eubacteriales bacterium OttesenSCG-928-A19]|nr:Clp protease ClpP [Eubacteriales bacterium OttesenSCG-928-A19]
MYKFWSFFKNSITQENEMRLEGEIASRESWYDDVVTPAAFRAELAAHPGDLTVWINSPGGDVFAASDIYTALSDHKGTLTVKVSGIAASAASIIAMAACRPGDRVLMSPTSYMLIHNPWSSMTGDSAEFAHMSEVLDEIREGQIGAYVKKTGKARAEIIRMLDADSIMNAASAVDAGFADDILFENDAVGGPKACLTSRARIFAMAKSAILPAQGQEQEQEPTPPNNGGENLDDETIRAEILARCNAMAEGL